MQTMSVKATQLLDCATSGRWQMQQALLVKAMHALGTRRKMRSGACAVASQRRSR